MEGSGLQVTDPSIDRNPHFGTWEVEADRLGIQDHHVLPEILSQTKQKTPESGGEREVVDLL